MPPLRVVFASFFPMDRFALYGGETANVMLVEGLRQCGFDVVVADLQQHWYPDDCRALRSWPTTVERVRVPAGIMQGTPRAPSGYIAGTIAQKITWADIVFASATDGLDVWPWALALGTNLGVPVVLHTHSGIGPIAGTDDNTRMMLRACVNSAAMVVAGNTAVLDWYEAGGAAETALLVPGGVTRPVRTNTPRDSGGLLYLGRISQAKGVGLLYEALHDWTRSRLILHGDSGVPDGGLHIEPPPCADVRAYADAKTRDAALERAYALVIPSPSEGMPRVAIEAMCAGVPVVSCHWPGAETIIHDGENGLLTPPGDKLALRAAIERLYDDPALRNRLADGAAAMSPHLSAATAVRVLASLLTRTVAATRKARASGDAPRSVSIVIPYAERVRNLALCLRSLAWQTRAPLEVIVVEHACERLGTAAKVVTDECASLPFPVRVINRPTDGPFPLSLMRNEGRRAAEGDVIATVDADVLLPPTFVEEAADVDAVRIQGVVFHPLDEDITKRAYEVPGQMEALLPLFDNPECCMFAAHGMGFSVAAATWDLLGGFDERFVGWAPEDRDFVSRAEMLGIRRVWRHAVLHGWHPPAARDHDTAGWNLVHENRRLGVGVANLTVNETALADLVAGLPGPARRTT